MLDEKAILDIAKQFLLSDKGKALLEKAKNIDAKKLQDAIKQEIADVKQDKEDKEKLTREERRQRRQDRRQKRKDEREERREERGRKIAENTPYMGIYITKGVVYDKNTKEPVAGIGIIPQLCLFPVIKEPRINRVTKEELTDADGNILYKAVRDKDLEDPKNREVVKDIKIFKGVRTNEKGEWEITFGAPVIDALDRIIMPSDSVPFVLYVDDQQGPHTQSQIDLNTEGEYAPAYQVIVTLDGEVKQEQDPISILEIKEAADREVKRQLNNINEFIVKQISPYLDAAENFLLKLRNLVLKPATVIQTKLFPLAFQLMLYFGIAKEEEARQGLQRCPDGTLLAEIIAKRNSVVRQINNIYSVIIANTALAFLFLFLSKYLVGIRNVIKNLNFPVATPPGVGIPYSLVSKLEGIQDLLEKLADTNKQLKKNLLVALIFLIISLIIILRYLKTIDNLIRECSNDADLTAINAELLALQEQDANQGEPIINNVNGFDLSVEVVDKAQVGDLPRRQAIAKNSKGITILKGEPSFAAEDQILIDELAFYIVQNNLKAD